MVVRGDEVILSGTRFCNGGPSSQGVEMQTGSEYYVDAVVI